MPSSLDIVFVVVVFVVINGIDTFVFVPRFRAAAAAGVPNARPKAYRRAMRGQWAITAVMLIGWALAHRSWTALGIVPAAGWQRFAAVGLMLLVGVFGVFQVRGVRGVAANEEKRNAYRDRLASLRFLLPGDAAEYRSFVALSITAGICEEFVCRGYLVWFLNAYVGLPAAVVLSAAIFGISHLYQGARGVLKTAVVGLVMNGIVLLSGWLVPAMILHALIDITSGMLAYGVYRDAPREVLKPAA